MSENQIAGGETQDGSAVEADKIQTQETVDGAKESVSYQTHRRLLGEKKALQEKFAESERERTSLHEAKLEAEGKKDELIQQLREQLKSERDTRQSDHLNFAKRSVDSFVESYAKNMGCVDSGALLKLVDMPADMLNDDYSVNIDAAKLALQDAQKQYPWLFKAEAPKTKDLPPSNSAPMNGKAGLDQLSAKDIATMLASQGKH